MFNSDVDYYEFHRGPDEPRCPSRWCKCPDCTQLRQEEDLRAQLEEDAEVARLESEAA
jgi:hypothetical protein